MQPIKQLLDRIRWDREFGRGEFELGYYDRLERRVVRVPLGEIVFAPDASGFFEFMDGEGEIAQRAAAPGQGGVQGRRADLAAYPLTGESGSSKRRYRSAWCRP